MRQEATDPRPAGSGPAGHQAALEATGIERRFGRFQALRGVTLRVERGQTVALFGPNGAGKTTLLRILALVLGPSAGAIRIHGVDPFRCPGAARASLGFLSHETALYLDLTPFENVEFSARLHGLDKVRERAREVLRTVGLEGRDVPVRSLSRGLQQRAALARTLVHEPPLLLLDEPWTGLDPDAQQVLRSRLEHHRSRQGSTLLTTHDLRQGYESADRVVLLGRGEVRLSASTSEIRLEELEEAYRKAGVP